MRYTKPDGCNAAVTANWTADRLGSTLTARLVCGSVTNVCEDSFAREIFNLNHGVKSDKTEERVSQQVTEVLGAMCLGCPHNTKTASAASTAAEKNR